MYFNPFVKNDFFNCGNYLIKRDCYVIIVYMVNIISIVGGDYLISYLMTNTNC